MDHLKENSLHCPFIHKTLFKDEFQKDLTFHLFYFVFWYQAEDFIERISTYSVQIIYFTVIFIVDKLIFDFIF